MKRCTILLPPSARRNPADGNHLWWLLAPAAALLYARLR